MKSYKRCLISVCVTIFVIFSAIICSHSITVCAGSDWPDILKQYPDGECGFADINEDNISDLFVRIHDSSETIVYASHGNSYSKVGTFETGSVYRCTDNKGLVVYNDSGNTISYDKYILSGDKLVKDSTVVSCEDNGSYPYQNYKIGDRAVDEFEGRKKTYELDSLEVRFQPYEIFNTNDWYPVYKIVIDQYINVLNESADESGLAEKYKYVNRNYLMFGLNDSEHRDVSYALKDIDNNGIPELFTINYDVPDDATYYTPFNICTFKDGVFVNFEKDMGDRFICSIYEDNEIFEERSIAFNETYYHSYKLNDGKFENIFTYEFIEDSEDTDNPEYRYQFINGVLYDSDDAYAKIDRDHKRALPLEWRSLNKYEYESTTAEETSEQTTALNDNEKESTSHQGLLESIKEFFQMIVDKISEFFQAVFKTGNTTTADDKFHFGKNNPDWTSVLKQYPDSECLFEDINADSNLDLIIRSDSSIIVYILDNNEYQLAGTIPYEDQSIGILKDHSGFAYEEYGENQYIYYKYVLSDGKLVQDDVITEAINYDSDGTEESVEDELGLFYPNFQKYFVSNVTDWQTAYKNVIDQYKNYGLEPDYSDQEYMSMKYNYVNSYYYLEGDRDAMSYVLKDLDNNNIPELIVGYKDEVNDYDGPAFHRNRLFSIYTFKDGLLIALEGNLAHYISCYILNNNEILYYIRDVDMSGFRFGKLNDGRLENAGNYYFVFAEALGTYEPSHSDKNGVPIDPGERERLEKLVEEEAADFDWKSLDNFADEEIFASSDEKGENTNDSGSDISEETPPTSPDYSEDTEDYSEENNYDVENNNDEDKDYNNQNPSDAYSEASDMLNKFYSYAWVNTTNEHDSSYVSEYTVPNSRAYQRLGIDYWQERPNVKFNSIYDVNLVSLQEKDDGSYDAYVSYVFEVHHNDTGMDESYTELAVDNIVFQDGKFLMKTHTWKDLLPAGSEVDISDFN